LLLDKAEKLSDHDKREVRRPVTQNPPRQTAITPERDLCAVEEDEVKGGEYTHCEYEERRWKKGIDQK